MAYFFLGSVFSELLNDISINLSVNSSFGIFKLKLVEGDRCFSVLNVFFSFTYENLSMFLAKIFYYSLRTFQAP